MTSGILIGELANQFGISTQAIRYYERLGLLEPPRRNETGYRLYSGDAITRLSFIRTAQSFGLTLQEIKQLLEVGFAPSNSYQLFREMLQKHLNELEDKINKLTNDYQSLNRKFEQLNNLVPEPAQGSATDAYGGSLLQLMQQIESLCASDEDANSITINQGNQLLQMYSNGERNFQGVELIGAKLNGAILNNADLSQAELMLASLNEACLERTKLQGAYLSGADMIGAYLHAAELVGANLIGVDLTEADLTEANLISCNLGGACLRNANLRGANLSEAVFIGADLRGADLTDAIILGTNFYEANLEGAIINQKLL
ncbi:MAG: pentapeptide repeat-containing protein [Xenococcaceae cyanobacterium MO_207.B15]|nr:pentapeptide repeat-containing protein [Xenococcaceae cyanobacterium MO_207.B15]MDJ0743191.1 pentapeptide repeat-containing protein [Xenococcaceae cyanobacterium MO_167.B27]